MKRQIFWVDGPLKAKRNIYPFDFDDNHRSVVERKVMLCDICRAREATIHKTASNLDVSAVGSQTAPIRHYCTACFEKTFSRPEQPEEFEQEPQTPNTPVF